jgi:hypothetical protein
MRLVIPMPAIIFIMPRICSNCLTRPLTSCGSTPAPRAMRRRREASMTSGLARSLGVIDWMMPLKRLSSSSGMLDVLQRGAHAGDHLEDGLHRAHLAHLVELDEEVVEAHLALGHLLLGLGDLLLVEGLLGLLDQRDDVAHAEDAAGDAVGVELLDRVELLADTDELDRLAGDRLTLSAAPPRVSESNLVRMAPSSSSRSSKALAVLTASWPVIASMTR